VGTPLPENIDGLSRAKLKLLLVKLLEEVADLRRAVAALLDRTNCKLIAAHPYTFPDFDIRHLHFGFHPVGT